ncbi:MAG: hypothetical protein APF81_11060 [Desulfosporosinus sp. BRH_c37]|nr:MAG: hypothetical protein APF81_11060 [Desulfosporosinus sp. BRH_c37]
MKVPKLIFDKFAGIDRKMKISIRQAIIGLEPVRGITDIHIWSLSKRIIAMIAHVEMAETSLPQCFFAHKEAVNAQCALTLPRSTP